MSVTVSSGGRVLVNLGANQVMSVLGGVGSVRGVNESLLWSITDGVTTTIGPYSDSRMLAVICTTGPLIYTVTGVDLSPLPYAPNSVGFTPAAGASNVCEVTLQVKDAAGVALAGVFHMDVLLSDAATGVGLTAVTASGAVAKKTASGEDLATLVAKKALRVQTLATGAYILSITDSAKTGFYVVANLGGKTSVSSVLVTGNYGA